MRRLTRFLRRGTGSLATMYGRRRCGKSRLLQEAIAADLGIYFLADEREPSLQRASLAREMARLLPGFSEVQYPDWEALLGRWWREAPRGTTLILDEFPALVSMDASLPSVVQRQHDLGKDQGVHLILCGSSQRMMQGLVLDRTAPLFGRSTEILKIDPLPAGWIREALPELSATEAVEAFSLWGGVPRYWELAADFPDSWSALEDLVLDPLGVLHQEPLTLLLDDLRDPAQSASILELIGRGCHRPSELAARLEKPVTSLSRPLQRLVELGLVVRDRPFPGLEKRTLYRLADPFLRFWFRFVAPNRSALARRLEGMVASIRADLSLHVATVWEDLVRASVPGSTLFGLEWSEAQRWWSKAAEVDVVAESTDGSALLVGTVKWEQRTDVGRALGELERVIPLIPGSEGREVFLCGWVRSGRDRADVLGPEWVLDRLR